MAKFLLISVILSAIVIPLRISKMENPRRGILRTLGYVTLFNVAWGLLLISMLETFGNF